MSALQGSASSSTRNSSGYEADNDSSPTDPCKCSSILEAKGEMNAAEERDRETLYNQMAAGVALQERLQVCLDDHKLAVSGLMESIETLKAHCTFTESANAKLRSELAWLCVDTVVVDATCAPKGVWEGATAGASH